MVARKSAKHKNGRNQDHEYARPGSDAASLVPEAWQFAVVLPIISEPPSNFEEIEDTSSTIIKKIIKEKNEDGFLTYQAVYDDGSHDWVYSFFTIQEFSIFQ